MTTFKNSNCDSSNSEISSKNNFTPQQPMRCSYGSFLRFSQCLQCNHVVNMSVKIRKCSPVDDKPYSWY